MVYDIEKEYGNDKINTLPDEQKIWAQRLLFAANGLPRYSVSRYISQARYACRHEHIRMEPWYPDKETLAEYAHKIPTEIRPGLMKALYDECEFNSIPPILVA